jgi:DNA-binding phage protein
MLKKNLRLKKGVRLSKHDPLKTLTNERLVAQAFWECLRNNDPEGAAEIIAIHLSALNKVKLSQEEEIPRSTIYHSLKNKNPTLRTVAKLIHCCL